jgi:hypothetical protein
MAHNQIKGRKRKENENEEKERAVDNRENPIFSNKDYYRERQI